MAHTIKILVVLALLLPIAFGWNDRFHICIESVGNHIVGVIPPIRQQCFCVNAFDQMDSFFTICPGTFCNNNSDWHTMRIHGKVDFGVEPPFVRSIS